MQIVKTNWQRAIMAALIAAFLAPTVVSADEKERAAKADWTVVPGDVSDVQRARARQDAAKEQQAAIEEAQRDVRQRLDALRDRMGGEANHDVSQEIHRLEGFLNALKDRKNARRPDRETEEKSEQQRRQRHIHAAIENLQAAGMHDMARRVQAAARQTLETTDTRRPQRRVEARVIRPGVPPDDVTVLRDRAPPRGPTPERQEIARLRRDVDAIRGELHQIRDLLHGLLEDDELHDRDRDDDDDR